MNNKRIAQLKAKAQTYLRLCAQGIKKYAIALIDLEQQIEEAIALLLKPRVVSLEGDKAIVASNGNTYAVNLSYGLLDGERCNCKDCKYRQRKCKHQQAVEQHLWCSIVDYASDRFQEAKNSLFQEW